MIHVKAMMVGVVIMAVLVGFGMVAGVYPIIGFWLVVSMLAYILGRCALELWRGW